MAKSGVVYRALGAIRPLRQVVNSARVFVERYLLPVWMLEGAERHSGQPLRIFFAGQLENKNYIASLAFNGNHAERARGRMWLWSAFRFATSSRSDHDLAIIDSEAPICRRLKSPDAFVIPNWVRGEIDLAVAANRCKNNNSVKADLRKIRERGFRYDVTMDEREFERFYHEMYLPYANQTYSGMTFLLSHTDLEKLKAQFELLLVKSGTEDIAGLLLFYDGGTVRAYLLGVKGGDPRHVKTGALAATYYFAISYLMERGQQRLHLGGSRPFLRDGVLRYKKKWGVRIIDQSPQFFVLTRTRNTTASRSFLANNPFFFETGTALGGAIFNGRESGIPDGEEDRWRREFEDMGISQVRVFDDGVEPRERSRVGS